MVEVIYFMKPCPDCKSPMRVTRKSTGYWFYFCNECDYQSKYKPRKG